MRPLSHVRKKTSSFFQSESKLMVVNYLLISVVHGDNKIMDKEFVVMIELLLV